MNQDKQRVADALLTFGERLGDFKKEGYFTQNIEADNLIWENPLAYLLAVILNQSMKAEFVWKVPFLLKVRLGYFDIQSIAETSDTKLIEAFQQRPKLHRFPKTMALRMKRACFLVIAKYNGKVENIWSDNPTAAELQDRFDEFEGIGQKKASMATNILVRTFGIKVLGREGIDISYDIHIRRVFLRAGLVSIDNVNDIVQTARELSPDCPGALDNPSWVIGRSYCHLKAPECDKCPISTKCSKLLKTSIPTV